MIAAAGVAVFLMWPTSYVPEEDQGYFMSSIQLPEGASLERTEKVVNDLSARIRHELPEVPNVGRTQKGFTERICHNRQRKPHGSELSGSHNIFGESAYHTGPWHVIGA